MIRSLHFGKRENIKEILSRKGKKNCWRLGAQGATKLKEVVQCCGFLEKEQLQCTENIDPIYEVDGNREIEKLLNIVNRTLTVSDCLEQKEDEKK